MLARHFKGSRMTCLNHSKFVLVFFNNILVYNKTLLKHVIHLRRVLEILQQHQLFEKLTKCKFRMKDIDYLGHIITVEGIKANPTKISSMLDWPLSRNTKSLRRFLGLTWHYKKLIWNYGLIAAPSIDLLRKNAFEWDDKATRAFEDLKVAIT